MLTVAYRRGSRAAFQKLALSPPTQVDEFVANIENGKDVPPDEAMGGMQQPMHPPAPGLLQGPDAIRSDPAGLLGGGIPGLQDMQPPAPGEDVQAKAAALGLKDMLFFENQLGPAEAKNMFQGIEHSMSGKTQGMHQTLSFGPQGMTRTPMARPAASPPLPPARGPQVASPVISSAPPPHAPPIPAAALRRP